VRAGQVTGLRIDHPDGLYAPGEYLRQLQRRCCMETAESTAPLEDMSEDELIGWVFTEDAPDPAAPVPREDRLLRVMAAVALAIAIVLISIVLFR